MPYPEHVEIAGVAFDRWDAERDLAALLVMAEDEAIARFIALPREEEALRHMSLRFARHWEEHGFGLWAVRPAAADGGGWAGACHPRWHPVYEPQVELAWSLTGSLRGRGLVTLAARAAADACFAGLGLEEVIAFVEPANEPSLAVTRRLGMQRSGETSHPATGANLQVFTLRRPGP